MAVLAAPAAGARPSRHGQGCGHGAPTPRRSGRCPGSPATRCCSRRPSWQHFERTFETFAWQPPGPACRRQRAAPYAAADAEGIFDAVHHRQRRPLAVHHQLVRTAQTLPDARRPARGCSYAAGLEIGCSIGTLSVELAQRCGSFLAVDASGAALAHAAGRLAHLPAARTRHLTVPQDWPDGSFDLIVVSEVGYYLAPGELAELFARVESSLLPGGTLVLCHWRHPISGWELDGDAVHAAARRQLGWADARTLPGTRLRPGGPHCPGAPGPGCRSGGAPDAAADRDAERMAALALPLPRGHGIDRIAVVMPAHNEDEHLGRALHARAAGRRRTAPGPARGRASG